MKVSNLLFAKFCKYSNRLVKTILTNFGSVKSDYPYLEVDDVNFHQGNGIAAEQVINADFEAFDYDYLFICDADDNYENVTSRWFVIGKEDLRRGQVRVSLKRDLASDFFDDIVDAKFMMERGNLDFGKVGSLDDTREPDPFVFASEGKEYDQIKQSITRLYRFNSKEPSWIIGYLAKNIAGYQTVDIPEVGGLLTFGTYWGIEFSDAKIQKNVDDAFNIVAMPFSDCDIVYTDSSNVTHTYHQSKDLSLAIMTALAAKGLLYDIQLVPYLTKMGTDMTIDSDGDIQCMNSNFTPPSGSEVNHFELFEYGMFKGIYPGDVQCSHSSSSIKVTLPADWPLSGTIKEIAFVSDVGAESVSDFDWWYGTTTYHLKNNRYIFVSGVDYSIVGTEITFTYPSTWDDLFSMMDEGKAHLEIIYQYGTNPGNVYPVLISLPRSKETFQLTIPSSLWVGKPVNIPQNDMKYYKELYRYRLVSPNQNGVFEWSPVMNYKINKPTPDTTEYHADAIYYQIAIDLKPFDPYIRVQPDFYGFGYSNTYINGLYGGNNFNDGRGLICQGDFSLTLPTSAWQNYKLQNKTFASSFGRDISSLELRYYSYQQYEDAANMLTAPLAGGMAGAIAGGSKGGPYGAVAGAAVGAGAGFAGGLWNALKNEALFKDSINKMKFDFNMNVQSIMARPDSISKVSPLDPDNKIWPTLEIYGPTLEAVDQFGKKMSMTGMAAMKMTTISDQMAGTIRYPMTASDGNKYQFFSGQIVQIDESTEMTDEMMAEMNSELQAGLYFSVNNF